MIEGSTTASTVIPLSKNGVSRDYGDEDVYKGEAHRSALD
jgi:hypothetical protein